MLINGSFGPSFYALLKVNVYLCGTILALLLVWNYNLEEYELQQ
jgi:hypothetical protein